MTKTRDFIEMVASGNTDPDRLSEIANDLLAELTVKPVRVPDEIATAWPDAPLPTVVVPAPDDPRYGQVFDLMLNICEGLKDARDFESTGDLNMAEGVWDEQINPKLDEVFKLLAPETPDGHPAA